MASCSCVLLMTILVMGVSVRVNEARLDYNYYKYSCQSVESIVRSEVLRFSLTDFSTPAAFIRLLFHDCQVKGCDASILLNSDQLRGDSEIASSRNFGVRKLDKINHIKSVLEMECPGQVSCADIIALAAKESVFLSGGPDIRIPLGRKDSVASSSRLADSNLPESGITVDKMLRIFASYGMNLEESVSILGAHTVGVGHCINVVKRLYEREPGDQMNWVFGQLLRLKCPTKFPQTNLTILPNDLTPLVFDNRYYKDILEGRGLFGIDSGISRDPRTVRVVRNFAYDQSHFFRVFSSAFVKLSSAKVLSGKKGEVRRQCYRIN